MSSSSTTRTTSWRRRPAAFQTPASPSTSTKPWTVVPIGQRQEKIRSYGYRDEAFNLKETRRHRLSTMEGDYQNTQKYRLDERWDQTLTETVNHHGDETGDASLSLTADKADNKLVVSVETEGSHTKHFLPQSADVWQVEEWQSGNHHSLTKIEVDSEASGTITANFNRDGFTSLGGDIVQTDTVKGKLTNHTEAEGRKEFKRYVSFLPPEEGTQTNSGPPPEPGMIGTGYETYGYMSTRNKDSTDNYNGTIEYKTHAELLADQSPKFTDTVTPAITVDGTQTGTDEYWTKHQYELTHDGVATTYGDGYSVVSSSPLDDDYGPVSNGQDWFGPEAFGRVAYKGELGEYTMAAPADLPLPAPHQTVDPTTPGTPDRDDVAALLDGPDDNPPPQEDDADSPPRGLNGKRLFVYSGPEGFSGPNQGMAFRRRELTAEQLVRLVEAGRAFRSGNTIAVPFVNESGILRWLVYDYHDAYTHQGNHVSTEVRASAKFKFDLPGTATGAIFQDPAAEAAILHFQANFLIAMGVVSVATGGIGVASAIATQGLRMGILIGAGEVLSEGTGIPVNPVDAVESIAKRGLRSALKAADDAPNGTGLVEYDPRFAARQMGLDPEKFANLPPLRQQYVTSVVGLRYQTQALRQAGKSSEEIARILHAERRAIGVHFKDLTPPDMLEKIYARNIEKYGDKLGPTIDYLRGRGKSWEDIIESASRAGGADLGF